MLNYSDFVHRRKSSKYKVGDRVYMYYVAGWDGAFPIHKIEGGIVEYTEDDIFYGIRPISTPDDMHCIIRCIPRDMRKLRKGEEWVA